MGRAQEQAGGGGRGLGVVSSHLLRGGARACEPQRDHGEPGGGEAGSCGPGRLLPAPPLWPLPSAVLAGRRSQASSCQGRTAGLAAAKGTRTHCPLAAASLAHFLLRPPSVSHCTELRTCGQHGHGTGLGAWAGPGGAAAGAVWAGLQCLADRGVCMGAGGCSSSNDWPGASLAAKMRSAPPPSRQLWQDPRDA